MTKLFTAIRALIVSSGFVGLWTWVALGVRRRYDPILNFVFPGWVEISGTLLIVMGGALALTCIGSFVVKGDGTPAPFDAPRKFVAVGPYRYVRNPMYVGAFFVILGFGFFVNSLAVLIFGLPWLLLAHIFVLIYEEPVLRKRFGAEYDEYCKKVNRWIPRSPSSN